MVSNPALATSGNRCGHHPTLPRWFEAPEPHAPRPFILRKLIEKMRAYYHDPAAILPSLNLANGSDRQQRSERREACLVFLGGLVHYLDLVTLRVGIPCDDGQFVGLSMAHLAALTGLTPRRAERACHDLVAAGIVTVYPLAQAHGPQEFTGFPAIRTLTGALFKVFGLHHWLRHEREKAMHRRRRQQRKHAAEAIGRLELAIGAGQPTANRSRQPPLVEAAPSPGTATPRPQARVEVAKLRAVLSKPMPP
jgi:hypothetical protein